MFNQGSDMISDIKFKNGTSLAAYGCVVVSIAGCMILQRGFNTTRYRKIIQDIIDTKTDMRGDYIHYRNGKGNNVSEFDQVNYRLEDYDRTTPTSKYDILPDGFYRLHTTTHGNTPHSVILVKQNYLFTLIDVASGQVQTQNSVYGIQELLQDKFKEIHYITKITKV